MRTKEVELAIYRLAEVQDNYLKAILYNKEEQDEDIKTVLSYMKELEAKLEFKQFGDLDSLQFENTYLDKQAIRDKIKELEDYIEEFKPQGYIEDELNAKISVLKELLGE